MDEGIEIWYIRFHKMLFFTILIGLIFRILLIPHPGYEADIINWSKWAQAVVDHGFIWLVGNTQYNYPPGMIYILYGLGKINQLIPNFPLLIKGLTIFADIGIVILILKFAKQFKSNLGPFLASVYFLHPAVLFDGVVWGQVDQLGLFLFLLAAYFLTGNRFPLSTIVFTLSFLIKLQNIIFIPIYFLYVYKSYGQKAVINSFIHMLITAIVICLPFIVYLRFDLIVYLMLVNTNWYPFLSLNAFNIWWIISGLNGMKVYDTIRFIGPISAKMWGMIIFVTAYGYAGLLLGRPDKKQLVKNFFISATLIVFAFFHLLTASHERYLFPVIGLLIILMMLIGKKKQRKLTLLYVLVSIGFFLNLYIALQLSYQGSVYWPLTNNTTLLLTLFVSLIQIITFGWFFVEAFIKLDK